MENKKEIFAFKKGVGFAWMGGRLLIAVQGKEIVDFGDGNMSRGKRGHSTNGIIEHRILGKFKADDTIFHLCENDLTFDFDSIENCNFLNNNKAKGKPKFHSTASFHFKRFVNKQQKKATWKT